MKYEMPEILMEELLEEDVSPLKECWRSANNTAALSAHINHEYLISVSSPLILLACPSVRGLIFEFINAQKVGKRHNNYQNWRLLKLCDPVYQFFPLI